MAKRCTEPKSTTAADCKRVYRKIVYHIASAALTHITRYTRHDARLSRLCHLFQIGIIFFVRHAFLWWLGEKMLLPLYGVEAESPHSEFYDRKSANKRGLYTSTTETAAHKNHRERERTGRKIIHRKNHPQQLHALTTLRSQRQTSWEGTCKLKNSNSMGLVRLGKYHIFFLSFYFSFIFS